MCQGESFESALAIGSAGPVVMRVFVKGNAGAFFSDREKIVASLAEDARLLTLRLLIRIGELVSLPGQPCVQCLSKLCNPIPVVS